MVKKYSSGEYSSVCWPTMHKALESNPSTAMNQSTSACVCVHMGLEIQFSGGALA